MRRGLAPAGKPRVLVVGDLILDRYLWGRCTRISPEAPVPIAAIDRTTVVAGGAANVAANLIALGAEVAVFGVRGEDDAGQVLESLITAQGASVVSVAVEARPTTVKTRIMAAGRQLFRFDVESRAAIAASTVAALAGLIDAQLARRADDGDDPGAVGAVVVSDYGKGVVTEALAQRTIAAARRAGVPVLCDPKGRDWRRFRGATALTPNRREAAEDCDFDLDDRDALRRGLEHLARCYDLGHCVITLAEDGLVLLDQGRVQHIPALAERVEDVTGAGDTVLAALGFALAYGLDFATAGRFASAAAAVAVGRLGVATVSLAEVEDVLARTRASEALLAGTGPRWARTAGPARTAAGSGPAHSGALAAHAGALD